VSARREVHLTAGPSPSGEYRAGEPEPGRSAHPCSAATAWSVTSISRRSGSQSRGMT
jgi:hypothetical protein